MPKATRAEVERRVNEVYQMLVRQESYFSICRYAAEEWQCSTRQTDRYISRAKELIEVEQKEFRQRALPYGRYQQLATLDQLFRKAYRDGDWRGCLIIVKEQNAIIGAYPPQMNTLEAIQRLAEEGLLSLEVLEEIKAALAIFRESTIASLNSNKEKEP